MGEVVRLKKLRPPSGVKYPQDPVTDYALQVLEDAIIAGPEVRMACYFHCRELKECDSTGLIWDAGAAQRVFDFSSQVCRVPKETQQFSEGAPFFFIPWQQFAVGSVYGWKRSDNLRRTRRALWLTGKGSGKTPASAVLTLYHLVADRESRPEIYVAGAQKAQSGVAFTNITTMIELSPDLSERLEVHGGSNPYLVRYPATGGFIYRIAPSQGASGRGRSGPIPSFVLIDEYHEHPTSELVETLYRGFKSRTQPLMLITTNAGIGGSSALGIEYTRAKKYLSGQTTERSYHAYLCELDEGDDPFKDRSCWIKTNPALEFGFPTEDYIQDSLDEAASLPSKKAKIMQLNFSVWREQIEEPWLPPQVWDPLLRDELTPRTERRKRKLKCYLGLDLAKVTDFASGVLVWDMEDGTYEVECTIWTAEDTLQDRAQRDNADYVLWAEQKHITTIPGKTIDYRVIAEWIAKVARNNNLQGIAYDRALMDELIRRLEEHGGEVTTDPFGKGIFLIPHAQGGQMKPHRNLHESANKRQKLAPDIPFLAMPVSINTTEELAVKGQLKVLRNPALTSAVQGIVIKPLPGGLRKFERTAAVKIDAAIAFAQAIGYSQAPAPSKGKSGRVTAKTLQAFTKTTDKS